jgi:hypothetical protein
MPHLSVDDRNALKVEDFIFHVVHQGKDAPDLLDSTPIGQFESFFVSRIADTLRGNQYLFMKESATLSSLRTMRNQAGTFVEVSKNSPSTSTRTTGVFSEAS